MAVTNALEVAEDGFRLLMPSNEIFVEASDVDLTPVLEVPRRHQSGFVRPYTRKDGTPVRGHTRTPRR
ncbi:MAG: hypothetical protein ACRDYE_09775 [Acidimicrobiales bacterium]